MKKSDLVKLAIIGILAANAIEAKEQLAKNPEVKEINFEPATCGQCKGPNRIRN